MPPVFTPEQRDAVRSHLVRMAKADDRVVAAAELGSLTTGAGDRWSDLDLTFSVRGATVPQMLEDWTHRLRADLGAVHLFDLPLHTTVYRVFLMPGNLQVDLSFTPEADFRPRGPKFRLLFGEAGEILQAPPPDPHDLLGDALHHALRARFSIERGRLWMAEWLITGVRHQALALAALNRGLPHVYARGTDQLPPELLQRFEATLPRSLARGELLRALRESLDRLLEEAGEARDLADRLGPDLAALVALESLE